MDITKELPSKLFIIKTGLRHVAVVEGPEDTDMQGLFMFWYELSGWTRDPLWDDYRKGPRGEEDTLYAPSFAALLDHFAKWLVEDRGWLGHKFELWNV